MWRFLRFKKPPTVAAQVRAAILNSNWRRARYAKLHPDDFLKFLMELDEGQKFIIEDSRGGIAFDGVSVQPATGIPIGTVSVS